MKLIKNLLFIIGSLVMLVSVLNLFFVNFSASNPALFALGAVLASFKFLPQNTFTKMYTIFVILGFITLCAIIFVIIFSVPQKANGNEDAVIILGCAVIGDRPSNTMKMRVDSAYELYSSRNDVIYVVSGGKGPQENISEAEAMKRLLKDKGIPDKQIILEDNATSTTENFKFSKTILDEHFDTVYKAAYVTNDFHCYRAGKLAEICGFKNVSCVSAPTPKSAVIFCYIREVLAVIKLWIFKN